MDIQIAVPTDRAEDFKSSLYRFLGQRAVESDDGFAMHWAEHRDGEVVQYVHFDSEDAAKAFQRSWAIEADDDFY